MTDLALYTDLSPLDRADLAPGTLRHYKAAIVLMIASNINPFNYTELTTYANSLPHSGKANLKAALKIMAKDYINKAKTSDAPIETIQRFLWAVEAMNDSIKVSKQTTERTPHWLSQEQVNQITAAALSHSLRDYIIMGLLLGAGLRREELEELTFDALIQMPYKSKISDVINVLGKGDKTRYVPIHPELAKHIREWKSQVKGGRVARRMYKGGKIGKSLSAPRIFAMVRKYGQLIGIDNLDPHDCRRSYGRLLYEATNNIVMVQQLLGHNSVKTTQGYIGLNINLTVPIHAFPVGNVSGD